MTTSLRRRAWEIVEVADPGDRLSRIFQISILTLIFANVLAVIFGTVPLIAARFGWLLWQFEVFSVAVFSAEFVVRVWCCVEHSKYRHPLFGRLRFAVNPMSLVDLVSILPSFLPLVTVDARFLRVLRMLRIFRVVKVGRYYSSLRLIGDVIRGKKEELVLTTTIMLMLLILSSSLMYYCENEVQPDAFPSIPGTMWWAVATLTTVGYGDVYPVTPMGKVLGSVIAILGIGMFALPTGLLGAGFVEEFQKQKTRKASICPHCGEEIEVTADKHPT